MAQMRILLVDDQSIILDGLEALLEQMPGFIVCGRAGNGAEAVKQAKALRPDVVLMDISMPRMDGVEATKLVKKALPRCQVLALTMYNTSDVARDLMDAGASGYLLKNTNRKELAEAIATVAAGGRYFAAPVQSRVEELRATTDKGPKEGSGHLTRREKDVVRLIVSGRTTQEIAELLFLSPATVETHRKNIFHKLACHNSTALVKYALERGWHLDLGPDKPK